MVKDIRPGTAPSSPAGLFNLNGAIYFNANDGSGATLWKSDGTAAGTVMVKSGLATAGFRVLACSEQIHSRAVEFVGPKLRQASDRLEQHRLDDIHGQALAV